MMDDEFQEEMALLKKVKKKKSKLKKSQGSKGKPVFLSKKQREELKKNGTKRAQEENEKKQQELDKLREQFMTKKEKPQKTEKVSQKDRNRSRSKDKTKNGKRTRTEEREHSRMVEEIRKQYMGLNVPKKRKQIKQSDRFKNNFKFEWDNSEDTSFDKNPLFNNTHNIAPLFGKGIIGGIDVEMQLRKGLEYEKIVKKFEKEKDSKQNRVQKSKNIKNVRKSKSSKPKKDRRQRNRNKRRRLSSSSSYSSRRNKNRKSKHHRKNRKNKRHDSRDSRSSRSNSSRRYSSSASPETKKKLSKKSRILNRYNKLEGGTRWQEKEEEMMNERDWRIFREDNNIQILKGISANPIRNWKESRINKSIKDNIKRMGFKKPTPIQMQSVNIGIFRRDMVGLAPTGSGKSAAFLIPMIHYLTLIDQTKFDPANDGPHAIILSPTRELAIQISAEFEKLSRGLGFHHVVCVGGRSVDEQEIEMRKGPEVIIGTPGRVKDMIDRNLLILEQCFYVIIDEFDVMIDLDLEEALNGILDSIPQQTLKSTSEEIALEQSTQAMNTHAPFRTTHLFSATLAESLKETASKYLRCPVWVSIGEPGDGNKEIHHDIALITESVKKTYLMKWIKASKPQMIVFCKSQVNCDGISNYLKQNGCSVNSYHGGKDQHERETVIQKFKNNEFDILVATDLAGRGLDVDGINQVINFDCPKNIQLYVHRAGRTGRAGRKGKVVTFLTPDDTHLYSDLVTYLKKNDQAIPKELEQHPASSNNALGKIE